MKKIIKILIAIGILSVLGGVVYNILPEKKLPKDAKIDRIVIEKSKRKMMVYEKGKLLKTYSIALGRNPIGAKEYEGDKKTPEGIYTINDKNPNSGYYKNLGISYPNKENIKHAKKLGKPAGGDIKIHGLRNKGGFIGKFHRFKDWTLGCIAVTNEEMEELYNATPIGTKIEIKP
ncbi:MAG: L,D-transpeptidase family protein [Capnocytophaga sp.]|nr:L,D-transpeptidase family protein [Capnocytophaga sp.]